MVPVLSAAVIDTETVAEDDPTYVALLDVLDDGDFSKGYSFLRTSTGLYMVALTANPATGQPVLVIKKPVMVVDYQIEKSVTMINLAALPEAEDDMLDDIQTYLIQEDAYNSHLVLRTSRAFYLVHEDDDEDNRMWHLIQLGQPWLEHDVENDDEWRVSDGYHGRVGRTLELCGSRHEFICGRHRVRYDVPSTQELRSMPNEVFVLCYIEETFPDDGRRRYYVGGTNRVDVFDASAPFAMHASANGRLGFDPRTGRVALSDSQLQFRQHDEQGEFVDVVATIRDYDRAAFLPYRWTVHPVTGVFALPLVFNRHLVAYTVRRTGNDDFALQQQTILGRDALPALDAVIDLNINVSSDGQWVLVKTDAGRAPTLHYLDWRSEAETIISPLAVHVDDDDDESDNEQDNA